MIYSSKFKEKQFSCKQIFFCLSVLKFDFNVLFLLVFASSNLLADSRELVNYLEIFELLNVV